MVAKHVFVGDEGISVHDVGIIRVTYQWIGLYGVNREKEGRQEEEMWSEDKGLRMCHKVSVAHNQCLNTAIEVQSLFVQHQARFEPVTIGVLLLYMRA